MYRLTNKRALGFTLAELLSALAILGVIATFTIPKVLNATSNGQNIAIAKETATALSGAYQAYILNNGASSSTTIADITPYLNYVSVVTTPIDEACSAPPASASCTAGGIACLKMHNGAVIRYLTTAFFSGTDVDNALNFRLDVDGTFNSERSLWMFQYYNGRLTDRSGIITGTNDSTGSLNPTTACQPSWFSW